nr:CNT_HP1_G0042500.mRNA.1.CDS.1 [Saccharomyces cerevisiae]
MKVQLEVLSIGCTLQSISHFDIRFLADNPKKVLVLDGGQGTELENRGIKVANPVWSTIPFISESVLV